MLIKNIILIFITLLFFYSCGINKSCSYNKLLKFNIEETSAISWIKIYKSEICNAGKEVYYYNIGSSIDNKIFNYNLELNATMLPIDLCRPNIIFLKIGYLSGKISEDKYYTCVGKDCL